jgi:TrwC relaxase
VLNGSEYEVELKMLRITTSHSAEGARKYFDVSLRTSDYYAKDVGTWGGKGAELLGLKGEVVRKDFVALVNNKWPGANGERLTARMNKTRMEDVKDKKTGLPVIQPETGDLQKGVKYPTDASATILRSAYQNRCRYIWRSMRTRSSKK